MTPTQIAEAQPLDLNEEDPAILWAEIWRLRHAVKGPDGYATWQDAATAERLRRVKAEQALAAQAAQAQQPAGKLHADGYFTWHRRDGYVLDKRLPCDFYLMPQPPREGLTDAQISRLALQTVYEGDTSTPYRDAWAAEIGIPFARAIERAHGIGTAGAQEATR